MAPAKPNESVGLCERVRQGGPYKSDWLVVLELFWSDQCGEQISQQSDRNDPYDYVFHSSQPSARVVKRDA